MEKSLNLDLLPRNERVIEVPFVIDHCCGKVLDVGQDKVGYTEALRQKGCEVKSCDMVGTPDYLCRFEDLITDEKFDVVLFLSSLEHFCPDDVNLYLREYDAYQICRCGYFLNTNGIIVITVPYGREYIAGDFIQWSFDRVRKVQELSNTRVLYEEIYLWQDEKWHYTPMMSLDAINYHDNGAMGAAAVYLGIWTF